MQIEQITLHEPVQAPALATLNALAPQLVLVFASINHFRDPELSATLHSAFPEAVCVGCSTAGEIGQEGVSDDSAVITAIHFDHPDFRLASAPIAHMADSAATGAALAQQLLADDLHDVLVLGQGVDINGSALIDGFLSVLDGKVRLSGGLAGDKGAFQQTFVLTPAGVADRQVVAIGFYGPHLQLSHGSFGGWQPFGPARRVTRAVGNVLFALDGEPALDIYKRYLGDYAKDLPASGLLFPFEMLGEDHSAVGLIRTILGVNETDGSLVLAGDIIENGFLRLMHASTDALVDGAEAAAQAAAKNQALGRPSLTLLVSCIGRKLVMGGRVDEEVEAVADVFGGHSVLTGFYSNGEISPFFDTPECKLHNQTMTITSIIEQ